MQVNLNVTELKGFINHIIENNRFLQEQGKGPVSVEVVGESGIGKTSTIIELAKDNNLNFVKLNLAQIEELGDLVGFPVRQFQMYKEKKVQPKQIDDLSYTAAQRAAAAAPVSSPAGSYSRRMSCRVGCHTSRGSVSYTHLTLPTKA